MDIKLIPEMLEPKVNTHYLTNWQRAIFSHVIKDRNRVFFAYDFQLSLQIYGAKKGVSAKKRLLPFTFW